MNFVAIKQGLQHNFIWPNPKFAKTPTVGEALHKMMARDTVGRALTPGVKMPLPHCSDARRRKQEAWRTRAWTNTGEARLGHPGCQWNGSCERAPCRPDFEGMPKLTVTYGS